MGGGGRVEASTDLALSRRTPCRQANETVRSLKKNKMIACKKWELEWRVKFTTTTYSSSGNTDKTMTPLMFGVRPDTEGASRHWKPSRFSFFLLLLFILLTLLLLLVCLRTRGRGE